MATLLLLLLASALAALVAIAALGVEARDDLRRRMVALRRPDRHLAEEEIERIGAMRRDPEIANMFFLSRFIVMIVEDSVGQLLAGLTAAWAPTALVSDKIVSAPFTLVGLWLALVCMVTYRRIRDFERWSVRLRARVLPGPLPHAGT